MLYAIAVKIVTEGGSFWRVGPWTDPGGETVAFADAYLMYQDRRVDTFRIYAHADGNDSVAYYIEFRARAAQNSNIAFTDVAPLLTFPDDFATGINQSEIPSGGIDVDVNRVLISTENRPRQLLGRRAKSIGDGAEDGIMAFASNVQPISEGQYGQYPLFALCRRTKWSMEVGDDGVSFRRVAPKATDGILGPYAVANVGDVVFFASRRGVSTIPGPDAEDVEKYLSRGLHRPEDENDLLRYLDEATAVGHFSDKATGREEIWIATRKQVYAYSITHKRWFFVDAERKYFRRVFDRLLGLGTNGKVYDENTPAYRLPGFDTGSPEGAGATVGQDVILNPQRVGSFTLAPLCMGDQRTYKKFRHVDLLYGDMSIKSLVVEAGGIGGYQVNVTVENIQSEIALVYVEWEPRLQHRTRGVQRQS